MTVAAHPCLQTPRFHPEAPWPLVWECHSDTVLHPDHRCPQSNGSHDHQWVAWHHPIPSILGLTGPGIPVRCKVCGGRKCDLSTCMLRRHHGGDHEHF